MGGIETTEQILKTKIPKFVTCLVSFEHSIAIDAFYQLRKKGFMVTLEIQLSGNPKLNLWNENDLLEAKKVLREVGLSIRKLEKKNGESYQYAKGTSEDGTDVRVWASEVFKGCRVVYSDVEVPEQTIPAHTEKKARIICNGNGGV